MQPLITKPGFSPNSTDVDSFSRFIYLRTSASVV